MDSCTSSWLRALDPEISISGRFYPSLFDRLLLLLMDTARSVDVFYPWTRHSRNQSLSQWSQYTQHVCSINVDSQGLLQLLLNERVSTQELAAVKWGGLLTFVGGNKGRHVICGNVDIINKQPGFWQSNFVVVQ
ncbi:hypothetical protein MRB53_028483 [Persea americana]|uniref:Uncharacterized protein n=1 Tax=Persea americana TaxID=3435 RepID=A0ACC2KFP1_PERAE|nr:hypothetical protein MRB53_028483 [Persea americana]